MRGGVGLLFHLQLRFIEGDNVGNFGYSKGVMWGFLKRDSFNRFVSSLGALPGILRSVCTADPVHIPFALAFLTQGSSLMLSTEYVGMLFIDRSVSEDRHFECSVLGLT